MLKTVVLKLVNIKYSGDSIGNDIRVEISALDKFFTVDKKIKKGQSAACDEIIGKFSVGENVFNPEVKIAVIEKDLIFNDVGSATVRVKINLESAERQTSEHRVEVYESRGPFGRGKKCGIFDITLEAIVAEQSTGSQESKIGKVALYKNIEDADFVSMRSAANRPELNNLPDNIILKLKNGDEVEIIEEIVRGDKVQNKSDVWHKVKCQNIEGYILSSFVEIEGQTREQVIEKIKNEARAQGVDENYAAALAGCESRYKPYAVSATDALGIFQLTGIAREHLRESLGYEISADGSFDIDKNIKAGVIYLKWLFSFYKGTKDEYKKVTAAWNAGKSLIPVDGHVYYDNIVKISKRNETKRLVECVEKNRMGKSWKNLLLYGLLVIISGSAIFKLTPSAPESVQATERIFYNEKSFQFNNPYPGVKSIFVSSYSQEPTDWKTDVKIETESGISVKQYPGWLKNAYFLDVMPGFYPQLFIAREEGQYIITSMLFYNEKTGNIDEMKFIDKDKNESNELCCSDVIFRSFKNVFEYDLAVLSLDKEFIYTRDFFTGFFVER